MPYCPTCAVEVDDSFTQCPLCAEAVQEESPEVAGTFPENSPVIVSQWIPWSILRRRLFYTITFTLLIAFFTSLIVDLHQDSQVGWSYYVLIPIVAFWLYIAICLYLNQKPLTLFTAMLGVTGIMFWLIDRRDGAITWSWDYGHGVLGIGFVLYGWLIHVSYHQRGHWARVTAWAFLCSGLFCWLVDLLVSYRTFGSMAATWSLPVLVTTGLCAVFMFYVRYRLCKVVDLEKLFHR